MALQFEILTLFPEMFTGVLGESILQRAISKEIIKVNFYQIRDYATDKHRTVDDHPYGGGAGMVLRCEPLFAAWEAAKQASPLPAKTILLSPQGQTLKQATLEKWAADLPGQQRLILVCGRYEGFDERFIEACVDEEVSIGDFVLSGGEIPAMVLIDGLMRLLPGALGNAESSRSESFAEDLLEYPQYTRPPEFQGRKVPEVLLSGDHQKIAQWRLQQRVQRTQAKRPDLQQKKPKQ